MKTSLRLITLVLLLAAVANAQTKNTLTGPHATVQTDGSIATGEVNIGTENPGPIQFFVNKSKVGEFNGSTGRFSATAGITTSGDQVYSTSPFAIRASTSDGSDNAEIHVTGGGAYVSDGSRGSYCEWGGNQSGGLAGAMACSVGTDANRNFEFFLSSTTSSTAFRINRERSNGGNLWQFQGDGSLDQDPTNGGGLYMPRALSAASNTLILGASSLPADLGTRWGAYILSDDPNNENAWASVASSNDATDTRFNFFKTRALNGSADAVVTSGDGLGGINFWGADGASYRIAARIGAEVDGTPGASDMPGRLGFYTSPDGASSAHLRWQINQAGALLQEASNGGSIYLVRGNTALYEPVAANLTAAGSLRTDCLVLTAVHNTATTVAAGTGVCLWNSDTGSLITVMNRGANALNVYPSSGTDTINAGAGGAAVSIAVGAMAICTRHTSTNWSCSEAPAA